MVQKDLTRYKGISFDIIGTLADYEAGLLAWCRPRVPEDLTDNQILESFARVEKSLHVSLYFQMRHACALTHDAEVLQPRMIALPTWIASQSSLDCALHTLTTMKME